MQLLLSAQSLCYEAHVPSFPNCVGWAGLGYTCVGDWCVIDNCVASCTTCADEYPNKVVNYLNNRCVYPTAVPTAVPTAIPTAIPTAVPTAVPTTAIPTAIPTAVPPTAIPTAIPTAVPMAVPTAVPATSIPTVVPTSIPTAVPTVVPTTAIPTSVPTSIPSDVPKSYSTAIPVDETASPTVSPGSPPSEMNDKMLTENEEMIRVSTQAAAIGGLLSAGSVGTAMRMSLLSGPCEHGKFDELKFQFHPLRFRIDGSHPLAAIVGNFSLMVCFSVLMKVASVLLKRFGPSKIKNDLYNHNDPEGFLRFPSSALFIFQFLYQGTVLSAVLIIAHPPSVFYFCFGFVTLLIYVALPVVVTRIVHRGIPYLGFYAADPERMNSYWLESIVGPGEWVSRFEDNHWVQKYASFIRSYQQERVWFPLIDFASQVAVACCSVLTPQNSVGCGHVRLAQAFIFLILLVVEGWSWPHARSRDSVVSFVLTGMQLTALVLMAFGYYGVLKNSLFRSADMLMLACSVVLLLKVLADLGTEIYIFACGRRVRLQRMFWDISFNNSVELSHEIQLSKVKSIVVETPPEYDSGNGDAYSSMFPIGSRDSKETVLVNNSIVSSSIVRINTSVL